MTGFEQALAFTLREEGGFVANPLDHGGATCRGVTQGTYDAYRRGRELSLAPVAQIQDPEIQDIYRQMYWEPAQCDALPAALGICHFDWAVNHGVAGAAMTLRQCGLDWRRYEQSRRDWYRARVQAHPDQQVFLKGWLGRVDRLDAYVEGLNS